MGFQQPPALPDYSKLVFMLNNSGAQEWNPAIYEILKNLIAAVGQSQTVISGDLTDIDNSITNITSIIGGLTTTFHAIGSINGTTLGTLASVPVAVITGVTNKIIVPLYVVTHINQTTGYASGTFAVRLSFANDINHVIISTIATFFNTNNNILWNFSAIIDPAQFVFNDPKAQNMVISKAGIDPVGGAVGNILKYDIAYTLVDSI